MDKLLVSLIIMLCIIPLVSGLTYQQHTNVDIKIPCFDQTGRFCSIYTNCSLTINRPNGVNIVNNQNMSRNELYYNYTINTSQTEDIGVYDATMYCVSPSDSGFDRFEFEITASGKEQRTSTAEIGITLFILFIVVFLLLVGLKVEATKNIYVNLIIKRSAFVLAIYLMVLNSAMMATIAGSANLNLTKEFFTYMEIFGYAGYAAMVYLVIKTLFDYIGQYKIGKEQKRTGDDDE
jgi:hypothetical protein